MAYLIDTDTIIYSLKGHATVMDNFARRLDSPKALSVITYGEMIFGARKSAQVEKNLATVRRVRELFPVIDVTPAIVETFGALKATLGKGGRLLDDMDLLIAATAMTHSLTLVTNNDKHFARIEGLRCENWSK